MRYGFSSPVPDTTENDMSDTSSVSSDSSFELISPEPAQVNENVMTSSFKPSVTFCEMFDMYPVDSDIIARISFQENFEPTPDDTVIVVPLAWVSVEQALCTAKTNGNYIKFDTKELPNTTDQFYQLCYCSTNNRTVMGVSIPFSFREVHEEELMEFQREHNKEFWTFRSRFAVLMDIYWNSLVENKKVNPFESLLEEEENAVAAIQCQKSDETEHPNTECSDLVIESPVTECSNADNESSSPVEVAEKVVETEIEVKDSVKNEDDLSSVKSEAEVPYIDLTNSDEAAGQTVISSETVNDKCVNNAEKDDELPARRKAVIPDYHPEMLDVAYVNSVQTRVVGTPKELKNAIVTEYCNEILRIGQVERRGWLQQYRSLQGQYRALEEHVAVLEEEKVATKTHETAVAAKLVNIIKEKEDLAESFNQYKVETEQRLMQSAKEYAKLLLKLKKYKVRMYNALTEKSTTATN